MGRKKKPFIDKNKATKFHLVPRSQADPLLGDPLEPQHVLKPEQPPASTSEEPLAQQEYYGVHFGDDYDYLQHLKEPGTAIMEPSPSLLPPPAGMSAAAGLPGSVFGSEVKVEGEMGKVLPLTGPQPNWDPDIVEALDNPELNFDLEDQLDDDFVLQANGGEPDVPVYVTDTERCEDGEGDVWWVERGDFAPPPRSNNQSESADTAQSDCTETDQSEDSSSRAVGGDLGSEVMPNWNHEKVATFTDYSISSSVVPRNKGLTQLDERFEKFMTEYDDCKLGAPEVEEREGGEREGGEREGGEGEGGEREGGEREGGEGEGREGEGGDQRLLDMALRDFEKNFAENVNLVDEGGREGGSGGGRGGKVEGASCDSGEEEESEEEREMVIMEVGKPEWDCESILSTYSNLYNHPTKIVEPTTRPSAVSLSRKTGIPLGTIPGPLTKEKAAKQMPVARPRLETAEERRERKRAVKEERKFRRSEKKATKTLFHTEQLRQERVNFSQRRTAAVV